MCCRIRGSDSGSYLNSRPSRDTAHARGDPLRDVRRDSELVGEAEMARGDLQEINCAS